jgi:hypothetical protein
MKVISSSMITQKEDALSTLKYGSRNQREKKLLLEWFQDTKRHIQIGTGHKYLEAFLDLTVQFMHLPTSPSKFLFLT